MKRNVGTVVRGIRCPIIKEGDNLVEIVINSVMDASQSEGFELHEKDVIGITEAVVSIALGNYVTLDDIETDISHKFNTDHIGILFPTPLSRNRFAPFLKGIARACKKLTVQFSYPADEVGNKLFNEELLEQYNINPNTDLLTADDFNKYFGKEVNEFTGVNYLEYYKEVIEAENCEVCFIFSNDPKTILKYTKEVLVSNIHNRDKIKNILSDSNNNVLKLDEIMNKSINGSGFNPKYGLLGSNKATDEKIKLFPNDEGQLIVDDIQKKIKEKTSKKIEVMLFADGAYKDPVGGIWELADPVVSPAYTKGLEGTPNEIKLKYIADNKYANKAGEALNQAIKKEIKSKADNLKGTMNSMGTTPRRYTDLIGSLCDLTSGSGDKGTPVVLVQGYFDSYAD